MIIDTHIHESEYSLDSKITLEEIIDRAKTIGLDGICITDHESNSIRDKAAKLSKEKNIVIIVGVEILTFEGDLVVFGLEKVPDKKLHAQELLDIVSKHNGIAISAHPFRKNKRGMGDYIRHVKELHGIECFNGSTKPHENLQAYSLAVELGIPAFGASDAHVIENLGKYVTVFPDGIKDEKDFIKAVKEKNVYPAIRREGDFDKVKVYDIK